MNQILRKRHIWSIHFNLTIFLVLVKAGTQCFSEKFRKAFFDILILFEKIFSGNI